MLEGKGGIALKVSVTLPNGTVIVLESDEPQTYDSLLNLALRELPRDLVSAPGGSVPAIQQEVQPTPAAAAPEDREEFHNFCTRVNPLGDMRRVVVAAEGARRFLGMEAVSREELTSLFDSAGWKQPGNLVQTLRNAARSSFRWLERVSGRRGYYTVTDKGRTDVLGDHTAAD